MKRGAVKKMIESKKGWGKRGWRQNNGGIEVREG